MVRVPGQHRRLARGQGWIHAQAGEAAPRQGSRGQGGGRVDEEGGIQARGDDRRALERRRQEGGGYAPLRALPPLLFPPLRTLRALHPPLLPSLHSLREEGEEGDEEGARGARGEGT